MAATAVRVFGKPITHGTRTQRALAAKNYQNADGKLDQVLRVSNQSLKAAAGVGNAATVSTTFGRVYNATGETVTYVTAYDWEGNVSGTYPVNIQNGQWAVFEHAGTRGPNRQGSVGALVYGIKDTSEFMISWNNPWKNSRGNSNTAYCEMNDPGYFENCDWDEILEKLMASGTESQTSLEGYSTKVSIEAGGNTPSVTAYFYLDV
ncbi:23 kDa jasmonate-induced protein-like [Cynara cardunculus var. scolymus]|uniref:23 kDa jasmonate-induced protein-like n=1 Tax=Cynara cardunculus var. scolymus TaxID=59895 RepID=UPI000D623215|nr:23 kDa jasmonate-induced protein-like [Cynara cardunculus var. scolymus]